jgi:hypothetical protein
VHVGRGHGRRPCGRLLGLATSATEEADDGHDEQDDDHDADDDPHDRPTGQLPALTVTTRRRQRRRRRRGTRGKRAAAEPSAEERARRHPGQRRGHGPTQPRVERYVEATRRDPAQVQPRGKRTREVVPFEEQLVQSRQPVEPQRQAAGEAVVREVEPPELRQVEQPLGEPAGEAVLPEEHPPQLGTQRPTSGGIAPVSDLPGRRSSTTRAPDASHTTPRHWPLHGVGAAGSHGRRGPGFSASRSTSRAARSDAKFCAVPPGSAAAARSATTSGRSTAWTLTITGRSRAIAGGAAAEEDSNLCKHVQTYNAGAIWL